MTRTPAASKDEEHRRVRIDPQRQSATRPVGFQDRRPDGVAGHDRTFGVRKVGDRALVGHADSVCPPGEDPIRKSRNRVLFVEDQRHASRERGEADGQRDIPAETEHDIRSPGADQTARAQE